MAPTLSVAMIVRDEAHHLPECLDCASRFADEICVVDTGSTDETLDIARHFGCVTANFAWRDDFAAARNASLDRCTGDWVFVLDADERIAETDMLRLRALLEGPARRCYRFITRNYTNDPQLGEFVPCAPGDPLARGFAGWHPSGKVRLFPNRAGARFVGRVHELVNQSLMHNGFEIVGADVSIHHYPLLRSAERVRQKRLTYLELGRAKAAANPKDPRAHAELGAQYAELGDHESAAAAYREAVRLDPANAEWLKELGATLHLAGRRAQAHQALRLATAADADNVEAWRNLGVVAADGGAWPEAADCFRRAAALAPKNAELHRYLAVALGETGCIAEGAEAAAAAVSLNPHNAMALDCYVHQMSKLGRTREARDRLRALLASSGGAEAVRAALDRLERARNSG